MCVCFSLKRLQMYKPQKYTNTDSTDCGIMTKLTRANNDGMGIYVALLFITFRNTSVSLEHTFVLQVCILYLLHVCS